MTGIWWCPWSSKPVRGSEGSWVGSIPIHLRHFSHETNMPNDRRLIDVFLLVFRPARWSVFGVRFVPLLLLAAGIWAVVYGGFYHRITVSERHPETVQEEPFTITVPDVQAMSRGGPPGMPSFSQTDPFGQPTDASGPPPDPSGPPPAMFKPPVKVIQAVKTTTIPEWISTSEELELAVNRAVTVEGLIPGPEGEIFWRALRTV